MALVDILREQAKWRLYAENSFGGGGGSPGGSANQIQYNDGIGGFAGDAFLSLDLTVTSGQDPTLILDGTTGSYRRPTLRINYDAADEGQIDFTEEGAVRGHIRYYASIAGGTDVLRLWNSVNGGPADNSRTEIGAENQLKIRVQDEGQEFQNGNMKIQEVAAATWADVAGFGQLFLDSGDGDLKFRNAGGSEFSLTSDLGGSGAFTLDAQGNLFAGSGAGATLNAGTERNFLAGLNAGSTLTTGDENVCIGSAAGRSITTGTNNIAIGNSALGDNASTLTGLNNIAIGQQAMGAATTLTSADNNVAIGPSALKDLTSGDDNYAIGSNAGGALTTGIDNIAIGTSALEVCTTGQDNIAIGDQAMQNAATTVNQNVAIGADTLSRLSAFGTNNIAIGRTAGLGVTGGDSNIIMGTNAVGNSGAAMSGDNNIFIGQSVAGGLNAASAFRNTVVGVNSFGDVTTGDDNTVIGYQAADSITTGGDNVIIGSNAGANIVGGDANVIIGQAAGPTSNQSNRLYIDDNQTDTPMIGGNFATGGLEFSGTIRFTERADHIQTPAATFGELWVRNDSPNVLVFTDDTGVDTVLGSGGGGLTIGGPINSIQYHDGGGVLGGVAEFTINDIATTTGFLGIQARSGLTSGDILNIYNNEAGKTGQMVRIRNDNASGDTIPLRIDQDFQQQHVIQLVRSSNSDEDFIDCSLSGQGGINPQYEDGQVNMSGTAVDFSNLPQWITQVIITVFDMSTTGTSIPIIQVGNPSIVTTGYLGSAWSAGNSISSSLHTNGFRLSAAWAASNVYHGTIILTRHEGVNNQWNMKSQGSLSNTAFNYGSSGSIDIAGSFTLDSFRITTVGGTDTFDDGSAAIIVS